MKKPHDWVFPRLDFRYAGDVGMARELQRRARVLATRVYDQMGVHNQSYRVAKFTKPDGTSINLALWNDCLGERGMAQIYVPPTLSEDTTKKPGRIWWPEGFLIVPKTAAAPKGYGLPKIDADGKRINPPWGTANGPLRECLINCFRNNKYPSNSFQPWPLAFTVLLDADGRPLPDEEQFDLPAVPRRYGPIWYDTVTGQEQQDFVWRAHWAIEEPYESGSFEAWVFETTNVLRSVAGRGRLCFPLRGRANAARMAVETLAQARCLAHEHNGFRLGYWHTSDRVWKDGGAYALGENVGFASGLKKESAGRRTAELLTLGWKDSPAHYENMVSELWEYSQGEDVGYGTDPDTDLGIAGTLDIALADGVAAFEKPTGATATDPANEVNPPRTGLYAAQVFSGRKHWLETGSYFWEGAAGRLSWSRGVDFWPQTNHHAMFGWDYAKYSTFDPKLRGHIYLWGRDYRTKWPCYGAALLQTDPLLIVRAALFNYAAKKLIICECPVSQLLRQDDVSAGEDQSWDVEWKVLYTHTLGAKNHRISLARFSQDAESVIWRSEDCAQDPLTKFIPITQGVPLNNYISYPANGVPRTPIEARFYEVRLLSVNPTMSVDGSGELNITITVDANSYELRATGECLVAKDYKDNAPAYVAAVIDDYYRFSRPLSYQNVTQRSLSFKRKLRFTSGKEVVYCDMATEFYDTTRPAMQLFIDYLDVSKEVVGGLRATYETVPGTLGAAVSRLKYEIVVDEEVLCEYTTNNTWSIDARPTWYSGNSGQAIDVISYLTPWLKIGEDNYVMPGQGWFLCPVPGINISSPKVYQTYVTSQPVATYSYNWVLSEFRTAFKVSPAEGVYNPMPNFGPMTNIWNLQYNGERLVGGHTRPVLLSSDTDWPNKKLRGYITELDLPAITKLPGLSDDIFPIGVI